MSDRLVLILSKGILPEDTLERIRRAVGDGDFWVVTSDPMVTTDPNKKVFCFIPTEGLDVPQRVGLCINAFLQWHGYEGYKWILKVDSDMDVPPGFFDKLDQKPDDIVYGCGSVAAISVKFFKTYLKGCYPVNDNDDGFLFAVALAYGKMEYVPVPGPWHFFPRRALKYGTELYKYGFPFWLILIQRNKIWDKPFLASGWLYGWVTKQKKYSFSSLYRKATLRRVRGKLAKLLGMENSDRILLVSSSKIGARFPQRSDHLLRALRELGTKS
ncbi:MAG: hypothetical protein Metus_1093 [Candidatus Methanosuratincola subterraneus]|uniref:Glycosyltransferase family 2 protein n=1 Tax=Methanosuratincola subterraneus TaxID=2593994 RepID=A0A444L698_METS7|nr:MAG: hypothetical protein Metus_1093 [Candidatus Methanosuratincola subterraneus]